MASIFDSLVHQKITVYRPGDVEYERSVANSNLMYRFSRPSYVVQPTHASQVQVIVQEAQAEDMPLTIKGGGHSYAGFSTANSGILLDMVKMNDVHLAIKDEEGTVTMQGGAQWGHVYKKLVNGQHDKFIVNGGRCPTVGVSGFTLGGGLGPFTRSFGLGCDTVESMTIVNAKGDLVTATPNKNEDLFWALRGAGGGNFGVLVKMRMKVQKLHKKQVVAGRFTWYPKLFPKTTGPTVIAPVDVDSSDCDSDDEDNIAEAHGSKKLEADITKPVSLEDFTNAMNSFYKAQWSNEMAIDSTWLCELDKTDSETPIGVRFLTYYNGKKPNFRDEIREKSHDVFPHQELIKRSFEEPSTLFLHETLVAQWSEEIQKSFPTNKTFDFYTSCCFDEKAKFEKITDIIRNRMISFRSQFKGEKGMLQVTFIHAGGFSEEPKIPSAVFWRKARFHMYIKVEWEEKFLGKRMMCFLKGFEKEMRPYSMEGKAKYINFADARLNNGDDRLPPPGESYFGDNIERLRKLRLEHDPTNVFQWSQSIDPTPPKVNQTKVLKAKRAKKAKAASYEAAADEAKVVPEEVATREGEAVSAPPDTPESESDAADRSLLDLVSGQEWYDLGHDVTNLANNLATGGGVLALTDLGF